MRDGWVRGAVMGAVVAVTAATVCTTPAAVALDVARAPADLRDLRRAAGPALVTGRDGDGEVGLLGSRVGRALARPSAPAAGRPDAATAREYVRRYGGVLGLDDDHGLRAAEVTDGPSDGATVRLQQIVDGLPVLGGELVVSMDEDGALTSLGGETTDTIVAEAHTVTSAAATRVAVRAVRGAHRVGPASLRATAPRLWLYDPAVLGAPDRLGARPVWRLEVGDGLAVRDLVLVDATTGRIAAQVEQVHAIDRVVCDRDNVEPGPAGPDPCTTAHARTEGSGPSADSEVNHAFDHAGAASDLFAQVGGFDVTANLGVSSGAGKKLRSSVQVCLPGECPMVNAFWNGEGMYYGEGFAVADDVVGHELTHGVIDDTAQLWYWYQSGAINESFADVFGEIVDLRHGVDPAGEAWLVGEDTPVGALRDMSDPTVWREPDRMTSPYYTDDIGYHDAGGVHTNSGVGNKAAYLVAEGGSFNGQQIRGLDVGVAGKPKTAAVYWRALQLLTSGSDYEDLYWVLPQACRDLASAGTAGIVADDCTQVEKAVAATEMHLQPVDPDAAAPEAPRCPEPGSLRTVLSEDFEGSTAGWTPTGVWGVAPRDYVPVYATSGERSMFGWDPDPQQYGEPADSYLTMAESLTVPEDGAGTFLRFDHSYLFEWYPGSSPDYVDGGRLEYRVDGGAWTSTAGLPWVNGPDKPLTFGGTSTTAGFGGDSHGYTSSRLDLSSLASRSVQLRWRITGDQTVSTNDGWWLDDVEVYTCRPDAPGAPVQTQVSGGRGVIGASWESPSWEGAGIDRYRVTATPGAHAVEVPGDARHALLTGLDDETTYTVQVRAIGVDEHQSVPVGHTVAGTRLRLTAPVSVVYGGGRVAGRLVLAGSGEGLGGDSLRLHGRPAAGGRWRHLDFVHPDGSGRFDFRPTARTHTRYRVEYDGSTATMGVRSSEVVVKVRPRITSSVASASVARRDDAWLYGRVYPSRVGERLYLQRRVGTRWRTVDSLRIRHRSYRFTVPTRRRGRFEFRAFLPAGDGLLAGTSPVRRLRVR